MSNWKATLLTPLLFSMSVIEAQAQSDWLQWGGPSRDFTSNSKGLAATWPATGPKQLWSRPLGAGHSAILASGNTLYTMYSQGEQEIVIALAADTGKTIWEHKYDAPPQPAWITNTELVHTQRRCWLEICSSPSARRANSSRSTRKQAKSSGLTISGKSMAAQRWVAVTRAVRSPTRTRSSSRSAARDKR